jgi:hypothetical protein
MDSTFENELMMMTLTELLNSSIDYS